MKIDAQSYLQMKAWFERMVAETLPSELMTLDTHPVALLEKTEAKSPTKARTELAVVIGDVIELTDRLPSETLKKLDERLANDGLPTLSEVRVRFSKAIHRVLKRGKIESESEYYAVRNAAELAGESSDQLWTLLSTYEHSLVR